jgi:p-aminobenzoyl-glutamate transporter AbgT
VTAQERSAWVYGVVAVVGYTVYIVLLLSRAEGRALSEVDYEVPLLTTVIGGIVAGIVLNIVVGIIAGAVGGRVAARVDVRDQEIAQLGERVGNAVLVVAALGALLLALLDADAFWIANALYLGFVLSAVLGTIARLAVYRGGMRA